MTIGSDAMDRSLGRFADSQVLYEAADEKEEDAEEKAAETIQEDKEEAAKKESSESEPEPKKAEDDSDDDDDDDDDDDAKEASDKLVDETGGTKPTTEVPEPTVGDGDKSASEEESKVAEEKPANGGANEMDIELTSSMDDVMTTDTEADAQLASLFEDDEALQAAELEKNGGMVAAEKAGIKKLGGAVPRVASSGGGDGDITGLWESAPDVSEVFK
jgi:hypothetical protein